MESFVNCSLSMVYLESLVYYNRCSKSVYKKYILSPAVKDYKSGIPV